MTRTQNVPLATLVTSFGPDRIAVQQRAVASWQRLGFDAVAVNTAAEVARLQPLFPSVRFVPAARDGSTFLHRPHVFIRDLGVTAAQSGAEVCGIINADVELIGDPSLAAEIVARARGVLVFGSRVDYAIGRREAGVAYQLGYDYFFFDRAFAVAIPDEPYCLGAPWWDYWLPAVALHSNVPLRRVTSRIAFHEHHETSYSHHLWMMYAGLMGPHLERLDAWPPLTPQARNAVRDLGKRSIRLARKFREHLERHAESIVLSAEAR